MNNTNVVTIDNMIDVLTKAKNLIGGDAPVNVVNNWGRLNLTTNDNIVIGIGKLGNDWGHNAFIIDAGDGGDGVKKTMDL